MLWGQKLTHTFNLGDILKVLRIWVIIFFCSGNRTGSWCHTHFSIFFIANTYNPFPVSSTSTTPIQENKGLLLFEEFKRKGVKIGSFGRQNWWSWWWKKRRLQQLWGHYQIYKWDWSTIETALISACLFAILMLFFSDYYKKWFKNLSFLSMSAEETSAAGWRSIRGCYKRLRKIRGQSHFLFFLLNIREYWIGWGPLEQSPSSIERITTWAWFQVNIKIMGWVSN